MRNVNCKTITEAVAKLCCDACIDLGEDVLKSIKDAISKERSETGREILEILLKNAEVAKNESIPICQDTGFAVIFVELGQDVCVVGGDFNESINEGVRIGYQECYLRKSIVKNPFDRTNTRDNTPCVIHINIVPGENIKITVSPKGGGSENMSAVKMLKPAEGWQGVKEFVIETVKKAGPNPCPPLVIGVGIGGTMEKALFLNPQFFCQGYSFLHP